MVILALLLASLLIIGCTATRNDRRQQGSAPGAQIVSTSAVPIEIADDHLLVAANVNGREVRLVLDTGASHVLLSPEAAAATGIETTAKMNFYAFGGNGRGSAPMGVADSVAVGPALATKVPVAILRVPAVFEADGLLGLSFLERFRFRLDYEQNLVTVARSGSGSFAPRGSSMRLRSKAGPPVILAEVDGIPARLIVDSGAGQGLILQSSFVAAHKLRDRYPKRISLVTGGGLSGETRGEITRLPTLKLGDYTLTNVFVELATTAELGRGDIAGFIGAPILRRFNVAFDLGQRRLWIEPNAGYAIEPPPPASIRSGLVCFPEGTNYMIQDVVLGSPASEAGVRVGDRLLQLNGVPVQSLKFEQIKRPFRGAPGTRVRLLLQTKGETPREAVLTLRDLL